MNKQIRLVMSDIDGTILNDQHVVSNRLKTDVRYLKAKNIPFILASARSPKGMYALANDLAITDFPLACYNGALLLENASLETYQPIFSHELCPKEVALLIETVKNNYPALSINLYAGTDWYVDTFDSWVEIEAEITHTSPIVTDLQLLLLEKKLPIHKLLLIGEPAEIQQLQTTCTHLKLPTSTFYLSKENYLEVIHTDVSKKQALKEIAAYYHLPLEHTMAIGEHYNDLPMLKAAGVGIVMQNAPLEMKKYGLIETVSNNDHGVSQALRTYILSH